MINLKQAIEKIKEICEDLEYEWFTYTHLQKFARLSRKRDKRQMKRVPVYNNKKVTLVIGLTLFLFFISLKTLSADMAVDGEIIPHAPEPTSVVLVGGGLLGMVVRFARKRFQEFKRGMDVLFSLLGLVVASPIICIAAVLVKLTSPGPILFKQERVGKGGRVFDVYKLRTMKVDAEKDTGPVWAQENDPRVTLAGRILRKMHIDEIPQLINVLKGEMSIVGPRPERPVFVIDLSRKIKDYNKRLNVKPGITGLAQVVHKYDETIEDVKKKIKLDLLYIKEMCVMTDLRIMARTIFVVLTGRGAR